MRTLIGTLVAALVTVSPAFAAGAHDEKGSGILLALFLGFAALIIVFQFVPGLVLFASMLRGLFTSAPKKTSEAVPGRK